MEEKTKKYINYVALSVIIVLFAAKLYIENATREIEFQHDVNTQVTDCTQSLVPLRDARTTKFTFTFSHLQDKKFTTTVLTKQKDDLAAYCKSGVDVQVSYIVVSGWFQITQYRLAEINGIRT